MTLYEKIRYLLPELTESDFLDLIRLQNDGDERGDYITHWSHSTTQPTAEQLDSIA